MPSAPSPNHSLFRALRIVVRADSDPARQVLFGNLMQARTVVRLAFRAHEQVAGRRVSALLVEGYGLAYFLRIAPPVRRDARLLGVAKHANAGRQIERIMSWVGQDDCGRVRIGWREGLAAGSLRALVGLGAARRLSRTLRIIGVLDRRHGFLVACRAAAAIAWYARGKRLLQAGAARAVIVSSDSNPEEVGFTAAARALGIPRVFVSHAYPTPFSPPLDFTLSILEGEAAVCARARRGPIAGEVVFAGVEGESAPLDPLRFTRANPVIGIFAPKAVSWATLRAIVADCRQRFDAARIVIRWHPSRLDPARLVHTLGDLSRIEESPAAAPLESVARQCDWVVADENSNVHLPVLKLGIPTVAVRGLGLYPESRADMYGFAAAGIVFPAVRSIADVQPDALTSFFRNGWTERFRRYDASYLRPQREVAAEVRRAVRALFDQPAHAVHA